MSIGCPTQEKGTSFLHRIALFRDGSKARGDLAIHPVVNFELLLFFVKIFDKEFQNHLFYPGFVKSRSIMTGPFQPMQRCIGAGFFQGVVKQLALMGRHHNHASRHSPGARSGTAGIREWFFIQQELLPGNRDRVFRSHAGWLPL